MKKMKTIKIIVGDVVTLTYLSRRMKGEGHTTNVTKTRYAVYSLVYSLYSPYDVFCYVDVST